MIKVYFQRNNEKKLGKRFCSKDNLKNRLKALFYILDAKEYLKVNNYTNIQILVNNEHLQNIANA